MKKKTKQKLNFIKLFIKIIHNCMFERLMGKTGTECGCGLRMHACQSSLQIPLIG